MLKALCVCILLFGVVIPYDCDNNYCIPIAENFLNGIKSNSARSLTVSSTCVNGSTYVRFPDTGDPRELQCITTDHHSDFIYDIDPTFMTYWQSENSISNQGVKTEQWIVLNLTDVFSIRNVLIGFTSPDVAVDELSDVRPQALAIERWSESDRRFMAWQYYASNCQRSFPDVPYQPITGPPLPPTASACKEQYYGGDVSTREPSRPYQLVLYSPFADFQETYFETRAEQDYFSTSAVRIRLVEPAIQLELASYYSVSTLQVNGSCLCYSHADSCLGENRAECECRHNTAGRSCQECKSLYNAAPWQIGSILHDSSCRRCDCNNNADSCLFNETTQESVCLNCYGNSYGTSCENCMLGYYNIGPTDSNAVCADCQCDGMGVLNQSQPCDGVSGQCQCKIHATGRSCDQCKDGYWNMSLSNPTGCQACDHCDTAGSEGELLPVCDKMSGMCKCKANVAGPNCSFCKVQTFNLSRHNPEGCYSCRCIEGASLNLSCEHNIDSRCSCISNIKGRRCDSPSSGYFVPKLNYIQIDLARKSEISIPATGTYIVMSSSTTTSFIFAADNETLPDVCQTESVQSLYNNATVCLKADARYYINSSVDVSLIFVPSFSKFLDSATGQLCLHQTLTRQRVRDAACEQLEYTVMASLYGSVLECECDNTGSAKPTLCEPYGGQCYCKPGVTGMSCDSCLRDHYNFSSDGCEACECNPHGSVELPCESSTGACSCHVNVTGDKCDRCLPEHYGLSSGSGCVECQCSQYSINNSCNDAGVCPCKPGVTGNTCSHCQDGYYSLSEDGCTLCNCSEVGSSNNVCSATAGICQCKTFVMGDNCDTCTSGFHDLWQEEKPCKICYCSGHSMLCSTQLGWSKVIISDRWSLFNDSVLEPRWSVIDIDGKVQTTTTQLYHTMDDIQEITEFTPSNSSIHAVFFYKASEKYLGDMRAAYYQTMYFTLSYESTAALEDLERKVILRGHGLDYELLSQPLLRPGMQPTAYSLRISEYSFIRNDTLRRASLPSLLLLLNNVTEILIPANFDTAISSSSRLFTVAMETGVRDFSSDGQMLSNVEQCICPIGYEGDQCDQCAQGFKRLPGGANSPTTQCVPCDCSSRSCDPITGVCYCTGQTTGIKCETCLPGYYGRPSEGENCVQCTCYGTSNNSCMMEVDMLPTCLACNVGYAGRLCNVCDNGYFGNPVRGVACEPCDCNGYSIECNQLTGVCTGCEANREGHSCEICVSGFYSDSNSNCIECACNQTGYDVVCHPTTGACQCLFGLDTDANCRRCLPGFYNHSNEGCLPCNCNTAATVGGSAACDVRGQCNCLANVEGLTCTSCQVGYFNSSEGCIACNCHPEGSLSLACDKTGRCSCINESITGRACDACLFSTEGDFPTCNPCGECYDGWRQVLTGVSSHLDDTFYQLRNLSLQYDNFSAEEVEQIIALVQYNISVSQDLYSMASQLVNSTTDLKISLLLLNTSMTEMFGLADILTNQYSAYSKILTDHVSVFEIDSQSSLGEIKEKLISIFDERTLLDQLLLDYENRLRTAVHNLSSLQQTNELLTQSAVYVMEELATINSSLRTNESALMVHLLGRLENSSIKTLKDNITLHILKSSLENKEQRVHSTIMMFHNINTSLWLVYSSMSQAYAEAYREMIELNSLHSSAQMSEKRVELLFATIKQQMATINKLKLELLNDWLKVNLTGQDLAVTNASLSRASQLTANISNTPLPQLTSIENLLASIQEENLDQNDIDRLNEEIEIAVNTSDSYVSETLFLESKIASIVEQVESALRDIAGTDLLVNKTGRLVKDIDDLQTSIRQTMSELDAQLKNASMRTSAALSQLDLFSYLTNQVRECSNNFSEALLYLNTSSVLLKTTIDNNEQILSEADRARSQQFQRLQLQAAAVQNAEVSLAKSAQASNITRERLADKSRQLDTLLQEYTANAQRLSQLEEDLEKAEANIVLVINRHRHPLESKSQCDDG